MGGQVRAHLVDAHAGIGGWALGISTTSGGFVAFAEWFDRPFVRLQTEIGYVQRGVTQVTPEGVSYNLPMSDSSTRIEYLSSAALLRLSPIRSSVEPYMVVGPQLSLLLSESTTCSFFPCLGGLGELPPIVLGGLAGVGLRRIGGEVELFVEVRLSAGATDLVPAIPGSQQNRGIDVVVGAEL